MPGEIGMAATQNSEICDQHLLWLLEGGQEVR